jgi:proline iminopeptidase
MKKLMAFLFIISLFSQGAIKILLLICLTLLNFLALGQKVNSFTTNDGEILYFTSVGNGPKVILLTGGPGYGVSGLKHWADSLSSDFESISFDQRGTGLSSNVKFDSTKINLEKAVQDLDDLRKNLGEDKLTICGISWGGMLAQAYASFFPNNTEKIVLVNPGGPDLSLFPIIFNDNIPMRRYPAEEDSLKYWNNQPDNEISISKRKIYYLLPYFYDHDLGIKVLPQMLSSVTFNQKMNDLMWKDLDKNYNLNSKLSDYKNHCIIIRGRQDIILAETTYQIKELLPQTEIITIERCGHFPDLEKPEQFFKILKKVLQ